MGVALNVPPAIAVNHLKSTPKNMASDMKGAIVGTEGSGDRSLSSQNASHKELKGLDDSELPDYQDPEVKKIIRKVDWRLPPILAVLYLFSFLDRSNSKPSPGAIRPRRDTVLTSLNSRKRQDRRYDEDIEDVRARLQRRPDRLLLPIRLLHDSVEHGAQEGPACVVDGVPHDHVGNVHDVPWLGTDQRTIDRSSLPSGNVRSWILPRCSLSLHAMVLPL